MDYKFIGIDAFGISRKVIYVAKLMTEAHHGQISGHSEGKGKGSVFTIKIPTEECARRENANQIKTINER